MAQGKNSVAPKDVMGFLNYYLVEKAPFQLPENVKNVIVRWAPPVALILGVLTGIGAVTVFGLSSVLGPFVLIGGGARALGSAFLAALFLAVITVLYFMAYPGLKARKASGWQLLFYIEVLYVINSLLDVRLLNALVGAVVGFYFLFQVRSYYK